MKSTMTRQNYLGVRGWVWGGNYKLERYLFILHRVSALGLLLFLTTHLVITTVFRIQGQDVWEATIRTMTQPWFRVGEYLVAAAFSFHAFNGARLMLQELGFFLGKPSPPVYPYSDALRRKRPFTIVMISLGVLLALMFLYDFVSGGR